MDGEVGGIAVELAGEQTGDLEGIERFFDGLEFFVRVSSPRKGSISPRKRETFSTSACALSLLSQKPGSDMRLSTAVSSEASLS
jgi:hypothetical protein